MTRCDGKCELYEDYKDHCKWIHKDFLGDGESVCSRPKDKEDKTDD